MNWEINIKFSIAIFVARGRAAAGRRRYCSSPSSSVAEYDSFHLWDRVLVPRPLLAMVEDLTALKDDMKAFIEGHGMRRFQGYVSDEVQSVLWEGGENTEAWKDFVELAKASNAPFLTTNDMVLDRNDIDYLVTKLERANFTNDEDIEEARWLRTYVGKTGFVQIGFPFQGLMFLYEISCEWYERYQRLMDLADDFGSITIDESDQDDER